MRKLMKKKVNVFGKKLPVFVIAIFAVVLVSATLVPYWGIITGSVIVNQGLTVDGNDWDTPMAYSESLTSLDAKMITSGHYLENTADVNAIVDLNTVCSKLGSGDCNEIITTHDTVGLSTTWSWVLGANADASLIGSEVTLIADESPSEEPWVASEARITINAADVGIVNLADLDSMSWDVNVLTGYIAHVDVFLNNGETLVFEYAKVDVTNCDSESYPDGVMNTFGDNGIVDSDAMAWLSSGPAGPCTETTGTGDQNGDGFIFENTYKSLADWKLEYPGATILRFEIEVDAWISNSESVISDILINGEAKTIETLTNPVTVNGGENLAFYVNSEFPKMMLPDTYTIETTVDTA